MGGPNLEVFKFGVYIMFPIAWMYYFGTNLDERFAVPDFWPKPEQTNKLPYEKEDIKEELRRLEQQRLYRRQMRLLNEGFTPEEIEAQLQKPAAQSRPAPGGPLDNSAAAAVDSITGFFRLGRRH